MKFFIKAAVLSAIIVLSALGTVFAEELVYPSGTQFIAEETGYAAGTFKIYAPYETVTLEEYLTEQCMKHAESINIKSYRIPSDQIFDIYCAFAEKHPELLIKTSLSWDKTIIGSYANNIKPAYITESVCEDKEARALMQEAAQKYVDYANAYDDVLEKILVVHDKMIEDFKYDTEYSELSYHAYGIFKNKTAVCQGYAQAFYMVMRELGIDCDFCVSSSINHIWNYVKIDGKWYHIDLTWDDPIIKNSNNEIIERTTAYHDNFLVSDADVGASHSAKTEWKTYLSSLPVCGNKYEKGYLFNINKPFTIDFSDGYFKVACTINSKNLTFRSSDLNAGILAVSEPLKSGTSQAVYYYGLSDYSGSVCVMSAGFTDGAMSRSEINSRSSILKDTLYKAVVKPKSTDSETVVYIWDAVSQKPYADKIVIYN